MKAKKLIIIFGFLISTSCAQSQNLTIDKNQVKEDLIQIINNIKNNYIYLENKKINIECIEKEYTKKIDSLNSKEEILLFFEFLLDEFYDSHLTLMANNNKSYRLDSPIFTVTKNNKTFIKNIWLSKIEHLDKNIINAEVLKLNGEDFSNKIDEFPTICSDKNLDETRNWIANKIISGRYNEPRILTLKLINNKIIEFDVDKLKLRKEEEVLETKVINNIGVILINNSLGNSLLINDFDNALDNLLNTKGLIIDLRNTPSGGDSYIARAIMGRFIKDDKPYQKHKWFDENYGNHPPIKRSWVEYVSPRLTQYTKPVIILVGRWTGSMGEGLAIGFEGIKRAKVVGTEMKRLAGSVNNFSFKNLSFGYKLSTQKLFHINGTPREKYVPTNYIEQTSIEKDLIMETAIELINEEE